MAGKTAASAKPGSRAKNATRTTATPTVEAQSAGTTEPRGARRKRETRARLLDAALRLMAERGFESVAINEITEAADVGFGSFYNHFESKEAIYEALMKAEFEGYADALDRLAQDVDDPAEAVTQRVRHLLLRARREPLWGKLLLRVGYSESELTRGLGQRLLRDIQKGAAIGRFRAPDLLMTVVAAGATVLSAVLAQQKLGAPSGPEARLARQLGMSVSDIPERAATVLLTMLGLDQAEAESIARLPLA